MKHVVISEKIVLYFLYYVSKEQPDLFQQYIFHANDFIMDFAKGSMPEDFMEELEKSGRLIRETCSGREGPKIYEISWRHVGLFFEHATSIYIAKKYGWPLLNYWPKLGKIAEEEGVKSVWDFEYEPPYRDLVSWLDACRF